MLSRESVTTLPISKEAQETRLLENLIQQEKQKYPVSKLEIVHAAFQTIASNETFGQQVIEGVRKSEPITESLVIDGEPYELMCRMIRSQMSSHRGGPQPIIEVTLSLRSLNHHDQLVAQDEGVFPLESGEVAAKNWVFEQLYDQSTTGVKIKSQTQSRNYSLENPELAYLSKGIARALFLISHEVVRWVLDLFAEQTKGRNVFADITPSSYDLATGQDTNWTADMAHQLGFFIGLDQETYHYDYQGDFQKSLVTKAQAFSSR